MSRDKKYGDVLRPDSSIARHVHPSTRLMFIAYTVGNSFSGVMLRADRPPKQSVGHYWADNAWRRDD